MVVLGGLGVHVHLLKEFEFSGFFTAVALPCYLSLLDSQEAFLLGFYQAFFDVVVK